MNSIGDCAMAESTLHEKSLDRNKERRMMSLNSVGSDGSYQNPQFPHNSISAEDSTNSCVPISTGSVALFLKSRFVSQQAGSMRNGFLSPAGVFLRATGRYSILRTRYVPVVISDTAKAEQSQYKHGEGIYQTGNRGVS